MNRRDRNEEKGENESGSNEWWLAVWLEHLHPPEWNKRLWEFVEKNQCLIIHASIRKLKTRNAAKPKSQPEAIEGILASSSPTWISNSLGGFRIDDPGAEMRGKVICGCPLAG